MLSADLTIHSNKDKAEVMLSKPMRPLSFSTIAASTALLTIGYISSAHAFESDVFIGNAKALSLGNAVTAAPPHIDSIYYNPAGLAGIEGLQVQVKGLVAAFELETQLHAPDAYLDFLSALNLNDPILDANGNATSRTTQFNAQLPGVGLVTLPVPGAVLGGISYKPERYSRWTFANSVFAPLMAGVHRTDPAGAFIGKDVSVTRLTYFAPTFGYKVTEKFWIGAGLNISYFGVGADPISIRVPDLLTAAGGLATGADSPLCTAIPSVSLIIDPCSGSLRPTEPLADLHATLEDYFSPTYNLGFLWHVNDWISWGGVYHSGSKDVLKGDIEIKYTQQIKDLVNGLNNNTNPALLNAIRFVFPTWPSGPAEDDISESSVDFEYPASAGTGVKVQVLPRVSVSLDLKWTGASAWDEWIAEFQDPMEVLGLVAIINNDVNQNRVRIPRRYQDYLAYGVGVEYQYNHRIILRGGYEFRESPIPKSQADAVVPIGELHTFGTGLNFRIDKDSDIDLAAAYITSTTEAPACTSPNANDCGISSLVYSPYSGLDMKHTLNVALFELAYQSRW